MAAFPWAPDFCCGVRALGIDSSGAVEWSSPQGWQVLLPERDDSPVVVFLGGSGGNLQFELVDSSSGQRLRTVSVAAGEGREDYTRDGDLLFGLTPAWISTAARISRIDLANDRVDFRVAVDRTLDGLLLHTPDDLFARCGTSRDAITDLCRMSRTDGALKEVIPGPIVTIASNGTRVFVVRRQTIESRRGGRREWVQALDGEGRRVVSEDGWLVVLVARSDSSPTASRLVGIDPASGRERWRQDSAVTAPFKGFVGGDETRALVWVESPSRLRVIEGMTGTSSSEVAFNVPSRPDEISVHGRPMLVGSNLLISLEGLIEGSSGLQIHHVPPRDQRAPR